VRGDDSAVSRSLAKGILMHRTDACRRLVLLALIAVASPALAGDEFEHPPIGYSRGTPDNCVSRLQARLESREARLEYAPARDISRRC